MLTCKQVSKALAQQDYQEMSFLKRLGLRIHVAICAVCKGYNGNVMLFQDMARAFRRYEDSCPGGGSVPENARTKWADSIQEATNNMPLSDET